MIPTTEQISELAGKCRMIPVCKEIYADIITPIALLRKIADEHDRYFLLESVEGGEKWGRYSFIGFDPIVRISSKDGKVRFEKDGIITAKDKKPFDALKEIIEEYKSQKIEGLPPFTGGLVGYFGYNTFAYTEETLQLSSGEFDDYDFMLVDKVIAYDRLKQKMSIIVNMKTDNVLKEYDKAVETIGKLKAMITRHVEEKKEQSENPAPFVCNVTKEEYCAMVEKTKTYIVDGDIFQAVIARRFETEYKGSLINPYRVLRNTNPSPYMGLMRFDDLEIMTTSPETLVKLQNGKLSTFPVAGSRPRGKDEAEDKALEEELLKDEKELSEHNMLVDLARNDIGRIAKTSSVNVSEYMTIHKYSKIMHICSEVNGIIADGKDAIDAISAILPAGTLSGAPKIRACEIIEELERQPRGIYGGAIGYIDFTGNMDMCIAIRMAVKKGDRVYIQAGGGIVADSVPEMEYMESQNKAQAIIDAIMNANEVEE